MAPPPCSAAAEGTVAMRAWLMMGTPVVTLAVALALAVATNAAFARSGGRSAYEMGGGASRTGSQSAGFRRYSGSIRTGGHLHDGGGDHGRRPHEFGFDQRQWGESLRGNAFAGWPLISLFHRYGDGDFQPCMRRDVYGDLYQGC
jgi:uncharacterized membrane protein